MLCKKVLIMLLTVLLVFAAASRPGEAKRRECGDCGGSGICSLCKGGGLCRVCRGNPRLVRCTAGDGSGPYAAYTVCWECNISSRPKMHNTCSGCKQAGYMNFAGAAAANADAEVYGNYMYGAREPGQCSKCCAAYPVVPGGNPTPGFCPSCRGRGYLDY